MAKKYILLYSILAILILSIYVISSLDINHENYSNNNENKQRQLLLSSIIDNPIVDTVIDYLTGNSQKIYSSYKGYTVFACKNSLLQSKYNENDKSAKLIFSLNKDVDEKVFDIEMNTCNDQDSDYVLCTLGVAISYASNDSNENNNFLIYTYTMPYEIFDLPINDSFIEFFFKFKYKEIAYTCNNIDNFYYTFRNTPIVFSPYPDYVSYDNSLEFPIIFNDKSYNNDNSKYFSFDINEDTSSDTVINIPNDFIKAICISKYCIRESNISFIKLDYSSPNYLIKINEVRNLIDKDENIIPPGYYSDIIVYSSIGLLEISNSNKRYPLINTQGGCNISERYFLKVYPLITGISKNQGFSSGFQDITITGEGLCGEITDNFSSCKTDMSIYLGIDSDENKNSCLINTITFTINKNEFEINCITTDSYNFTESNVTKTSIGVEYHDATQLTNIELFMGTYSSNISEATETIYYKSRINFDISADHNIKYSHYISAFESFDFFLVNEENQTEVAYSKQNISSNPYYKYDYVKESNNYTEFLPGKYYDTFNDGSKTNLSTTTSILQCKVGGIIYKNSKLNPCNNNFIKTTLTVDDTGENKIDVYEITENSPYTIDNICDSDNICTNYHFALSNVISSYTIKFDALASTYFSLYLAFNNIKEVQNNFYIESYNQEQITFIFNFNTEKKYYLKCSNYCSFAYDISNIFIGQAYLDRSLPPELYRRPKPSGNTKGHFLINYKNNIIDYDFSWEPLCNNKSTNCDFTFDFEDANYSITEITYDYDNRLMSITFNSIIPITFHEKLKLKVGYNTSSFKDKVGYNGSNKYTFSINSEYIYITETINDKAIKYFTYIFHSDYGRVKDSSNYNYCNASDIVHNLEFLNKNSGIHSGYCTCNLGFDEDNSSCKCPCDFRKADKSCSNCSEDQYYNEGECVDICPIYKKAVDDECKYCDYCSTDEFVYNNKCYSDSDCLNICIKEYYTDEINIDHYYCISCGEEYYAYNNTCVQSCYSSTILSKMNCFGSEYKYCQQCLTDFIIFDNSCISTSEKQDWMIETNDELRNSYLDYCKENNSYAFYKEANSIECYATCPEHTIPTEVPFNEKMFNVCDYCGKNDSNYSFFYKDKCVQSCSPGLIQGNDNNGLKYCLSCHSNQLLNKSAGECLDLVDSICPKSYINNETELIYDDNTTETISYCSVCESGYEYKQSCISTCIDGSILIPNESNASYCSDCPEDKPYAYNNDCYESCYEGLASEYNSNNERYKCYECGVNKKVFLGDCVDSCPKASIETPYNSNNLNTNYCKLCSDPDEVVYNSTCLTGCPLGTQKIIDNTSSIDRYYCEVCGENQVELEGSCEVNCLDSTEKVYYVMKNQETNSNYCVLCSSPNNLLYINECVSECCESCIQNGLICTPTNCVDNTQQPLFYNEQCYKACPDQTKMMSTGNYCESCDVANGYIYVQNNTCVKECDIKAYKVNHSCLFCDNNKVNSDETDCVNSCNSENEVYDENTNRCILCDNFIHNNTCITSCPSSSTSSSSNYYTQNKQCVFCYNYLDTTYNTCRDSCLSNQFTNIDLKQCITCSSTKPYYFKDTNSCVSNCPENFGIINSNSKICQDVSSMYILNNQYVSTCPKGYLANSSRVCYKCSEINKIDFYNSNGDVIDCIDSCSNSNNLYQINSNCYSCNSGLFKISNNNVICVDSCSEGYIKTQSNNNSYFQCEKCPYYYNLNVNITTCVSKCGENMISNSNNKCITCKEAGLLSLNNKCVQSCNQDEYSIENNTCILKTLTCSSSLNYCDSNGDCKEKKDDSNNIVLYCICKANYYGLNCEYPESEYHKYIDNVINTIDSLSKITAPLTTRQLNEINELLNLINNNSTLLSTLENENSDLIEEMLTISETQLELINDNKANVTDSLLMLVDSSLTLNNNYNNKANITNVKSELKQLSSSLALNQDQFENYLSTKNSSVLYSGTTFSIQITDNSETNLLEAVEYSLPIINYTECEKVLHELGYLKSNESIYVSNIQFSGKTSSKNTNNSTVQSSVSTTYISSLTGNSVDVSPCDTITTKIKVTDSSFNLTNYLELYDSLGVDVMNSEDDFFYDICIPYSGDNGTDATIGTRRNTYNTTAGCSEGCDYNGIDTNGYVICSCNSTATETEISTSVSDSSFNFNVFGNIVVVKCFFRAFSKIIQNIAFWVFAAALISTLIISFTYNSIFTGYKLIETKLDTILENDLDEDLIINEESKTVSNKRLSLRNSIKNNIVIHEQSVIKPGNVGGVLDQNNNFTPTHKVTPINSSAVNSRPQNLFDLILSTVFLVNENSVYVLFKNIRNKYSRVAKIKSRIKKNREYHNKNRGIGQLKQANDNYIHNNIISHNNSILNVTDNIYLSQVKNKIEINRNKKYLCEKRISNNLSVKNQSNNNYSLDKTSSSITTRSKCLLIPNNTYGNNNSITKRLINNESISLCNDNDNFKLLCSSITEEVYFSSFKISTNKTNYYNRRKYLLIQNDLSVFDKIIKKKVGRAYKEWIKSAEIETMFYNYNLDLQRKIGIKNLDNSRYSPKSFYSKEEENYCNNSESFEEMPSLGLEEDIPNFKIKNFANKSINYCSSNNKKECYFYSEANNNTNNSVIRSITQDFLSFNINHRRLSFTDNLSKINSKNNYSFSNDSYFNVKTENIMTKDKKYSNIDEYKISNVFSYSHNTLMNDNSSDLDRKSSFKNEKIGKNIKNMRNSGILNKLGLKDYKEKSKFYKTNILDVNKIENELNCVNIVNIKENKNLNISSKPYFYNYLLGNIKEIEEGNMNNKEAQTLNNIKTNKTNDNNKMQSSRSISFLQHKENNGFYCDEKNENDCDLRKKNIHTSFAKYPILEEDELLKIFNIENEYKVYVHSLKSISSQIKDTNRSNAHNKTKNSSNNNIIGVNKKSKIEKFLQDDRKIFQYIWSEIKEKHSLLNLFFFFSIIYPFHIRLLTFFYETSLSFALNAIFYSDSMIEARADKQLDNEGSVGFWFTFTQNLYVSFVSAIIPTFFMQTIGRLIEPSKNCILFFQKQLISKDIYTIKVS